ncbi:MAG: PIG-L family deacetylase [Candidatus Hydrogenedentes bacterium]|nr:PIG-L family deacetylase [Candidatus Hydrogenedentota bacterium]
MRRSFLFLSLLLSPALALAQDLGEVALRQALRDMGNDLRLLCVAAHPDDEDGASLALHRYRYGVETFALIATRGEGGQNEIGPELYNELGAIRTKEMRAAAEVTGAHLLFLDMPEFGYSKTPEETLEIWGHEETLRRMVRVLREVKPHVIITHHGRDKDHGHHQAVGAILQEAFDKAGDPNVFPEQMAEGLDPWQPWRLYIRAWQPSAGSVELDISALDSLRGKTYAQMAAHALELHASQGMTFFIERYLTGRPKAYYDLVKEAPVPKSAEGNLDNEAGPLFAGLPLETDPELRSLSESTASRAELKPQILKALHNIVIAKSESSTMLARLRREAIWVNNDAAEALNRAAVAATELRLQAKADDLVVVPGQTLEITATLTDFGEADAQTVDFQMTGISSLAAAMPRPEQRKLSPSGDATVVFQLEIPANAAPTLPQAEHLFDPTFLAPQLTVVAEVSCGEAMVQLLAPLHIDIAPALSIEFQHAPYLLRPGQPAVEVPVLLTNRTPGARDAVVQFTAPAGWSIDQQDHPVRFQAEDEQALVLLRLSPPQDRTPGVYPLESNTAGNAEKPAAEVHVVDLAVPLDARVGLIATYDTTYRDTLEKLGVPCEILGLEDFTTERLDQFTTIIVDMRAYQYRPDLVANNHALLDYVKRGGTVFVNYQKTFDWKPEYAPYPIELSRNRVTREDAPVTVLDPNHPLVTTPNRLGPDTWADWIQERGLYFPETWAPEYTPLLDMNDPDEDIPPGSLLVAGYGKGTYIYSALVWYRQLRTLHPGALKFLANVVATSP